LHYDANVTFRIRAKIIESYGAGATEMGTLPGAGSQIKYQKKPELSLKFRTRATAI